MFSNSVTESLFKVRHARMLIIPAHKLVIPVDVHHAYQCSSCPYVCKLSKSLQSRLYARHSRENGNPEHCKLSNSLQSRLYARHSRENGNPEHCKLSNSLQSRLYARHSCIVSKNWEDRPENCKHAFCHRANFVCSVSKPNLFSCLSSQFFNILHSVIEIMNIDNSICSSCPYVCKISKSLQSRLYARHSRENGNPEHCKLSNSLQSRLYARHSRENGNPEHCKLSNSLQSRLYARHSRENGNPEHCKLSKSLQSRLYARHSRENGNPEHCKLSNSLQLYKCEIFTWYWLCLFISLSFMLHYF